MKPEFSASSPSNSKAAAPLYIAVGRAVAYCICTGLTWCSRCFVPCHCANTYSHGHVDVPAARQVGAGSMQVGAGSRQAGAGSRAGSRAGADRLKVRRGEHRRDTVHAAQCVELDISHDCDRHSYDHHGERGLRLTGEAHPEERGLVEHHIGNARQLAHLQRHPFRVSQRAPTHCVARVTWGTWYTPMEFAARLRFIVAMDPNAPSASFCTSLFGRLTGWKMPRRFQHSSITLVKTKWHVVRHSTAGSEVSDGTHRARRAGRQPQRS
jgi:hypothetical protein